MPIRRIIKGVNDFHDNYFKDHQEMFEKLSQGQKPEILFITCSDSRVDPNLLTQTQPGELFIIRNIGNIIPPYSPLNNSEGAGIEYAVESLNVKDIVVCGHSDCGSMKGLLHLNELPEQMPLVYNWLKCYAEATHRSLRQNYQDYSGKDLLKIAIQNNVLCQVENLETYPSIHARLHGGNLRLHAWVYEIETGKIWVYNSTQCQFVPLEAEPFPVPDPLADLHP